jgi:hypothetical protein
MDEILKKLTAAGVSTDMIEKLKSGLGDKFESTIMTSGLKAAAEKVGLDASTLPDIDFKNALEAVEELSGKDLNRDGKVGDGDLKTGVTEALENAKEAIANTDLTGAKEFAQKSATGLFAKIKSLFGGNKAV